MEPAKSAEQQSNSVCERSQIMKLERLEQEYLRLTHTQNNSEVRTENANLELEDLMS